MTPTTQATSAGFPNRELEFVYDWQGRRIAKKVTEGTFVKHYRFLYKGWNPVTEWTATGANPVNSISLRQACLWGLDLSGTPQGAGGVGGLLLITNHSALITSYYPAFDGNGNIIAWTASNSDTLQRIDYDPFGNIVTREGTSGFEAPAWGFSTKYQDRETGLLYYGHRFYDPITGRWPSRDPIEENGGVNLYGFVRNDGINRLDYLGLSPETDLGDWSAPSFSEEGKECNSDPVKASDVKMKVTGTFPSGNKTGGKDHVDVSIAFAWKIEGSNAYVGPKWKYHTCFRCAAAQAVPNTGNCAYIPRCNDQASCNFVACDPQSTRVDMWYLSCECKDGKKTWVKKKKSKGGVIDGERSFFGNWTWTATFNSNDF
jgi:RHS repeat-associated protein